MAVTPGTNSWCSNTDANSYFSTRYLASGWAALPSADQDSLLITAFKFLRRQPMFRLGPDITDQIVKDAQCEAAWWLKDWYDIQMKHEALYAQGIRNYSFSGFSERFDEAPQCPRFIINMLLAYVAGNGNYAPRARRTYSVEP